MLSDTAAVVERHAKSVINASVTNTSRCYAKSGYGQEEPRKLAAMALRTLEIQLFGEASAAAEGSFVASADQVAAQKAYAAQLAALAGKETQGQRSASKESKERKETLAAERAANVIPLLFTRECSQRLLTTIKREEEAAVARAAQAAAEEAAQVAEEAGVHRGGSGKATGVFTLPGAKSSAPSSPAASRSAGQSQGDASPSRGAGAGPPKPRRQKPSEKESAATAKRWEALVLRLLEGDDGADAGDGFVLEEQPPAPFDWSASVKDLFVSIEQRGPKARGQQGTPLGFGVRECCCASGI